MKIDIHHNTQQFDSYRVQRVRSLFNLETNADFSLAGELPIEQSDWQIGVIVGPSGSGKSSIGAALWGGNTIYKPAWPGDLPICEAIAPTAPFDNVTAALAAVGLGSVPTWLRPYGVLSNGEQFRAVLARLIAEAPRTAVVDEFSSVVDRQVAKIASAAFSKAWRRTGGQAVLLSCHYDVLEWLQPDWVFDTATGQFQRRSLRPRPSIKLEIHETGWEFWPAFERHHYLKLPLMMAATKYVGVVNGQLVAHLGMTTRPGLIEARAARLVVMPEWQGVGIGIKFLNAICNRWLEGGNRYEKPMRTIFNTSHPGLVAALRRDPKWTQISATLHGDNRARNVVSLNESARRHGCEDRGNAGYGGHFRAVQGFRYLGD